MLDRLIPMASVRLEDSPFVALFPEHVHGGLKGCLFIKAAGTPQPGVVCFRTAHIYYDVFVDGKGSEIMNPAEGGEHLLPIDPEMNLGQ